MNWTEKNTFDLLSRVIDSNKGDEVEATLTAQDYGLTRFAGNIIHQNMREEDAILSVRVALGQKVGSYATNQLNEEGIRQAVQRAAEIADLPVELLAILQREIEERLQSL